MTSGGETILHSAAFICVYNFVNTLQTVSTVVLVIYIHSKLDNLCIELFVAFIGISASLRAG